MYQYLHVITYQSIKSNFLSRAYVIKLSKIMTEFKVKQQL